MDLSTRLLLKKNFTFHMKDEEGFLMDCVDGDVYEINSTTKYILENCNGMYSLSEILQMLYDASESDEFEVVEEDMLEIANYFVTNNICDIVNANE